MFRPFELLGAGEAAAGRAASGARQRALRAFAAMGAGRLETGAPEDTA